MSLKGFIASDFHNFYFNDFTVNNYKFSFAFKCSFSCVNMDRMMFI